MSYTNPTKSVFRVDIELDKINSFADLEKILRDLSNGLHTGTHDVYNDNGELVGHYGTMRGLR